MSTDIDAAVNLASKTGTRFLVGKNIPIGSAPRMCKPGGFVTRFDVDWDGNHVGKVVGFCDDGTKLDPTMGAGGATPDNRFGYYTTRTITSPTGWSQLPFGSNGSWVTSVGGAGGGTTGTIDCGSGRKIIGYDSASGWWLDSGGFWCDNPTALKASADAAAAAAVAAQAAAAKAAADKLAADKAAADAASAAKAAAAAAAAGGGNDSGAAADGGNGSGSADDSGATDSTKKPEDTILGFPPIVFWFFLIVIFIIVVVVFGSSKKKELNHQG